MEDLTAFLHVNLGNILTILSFIGGGIWFISTMRTAMELLSMRMTGIERLVTGQAEELKKLTQVLITLGRYEERFLRLEGMLDELRHGKGFIHEGFKH